MKKTTAILLIFALCFLLFACHHADEEGAADVDVADREITAPADGGEKTATAAETEANGAPAPQNGTKTAADAVPVTQSSDETAENGSPVPQDGGETPREQSPEPGYTADMPFSPYEVVVTLTAEESAKNKTYTPADFPQLDVFNVFEYDYFPEKYYPDHADKKTLFLMLNEPGKDNVLGAVRIAEEDERVFDACPNVLEMSTDYMAVTVTKEQAKKQTNYTANDFPDAKLRGIFAHDRITGSGSKDKYPDTIAGTETAEERTMFPEPPASDSREQAVIDALRCFAKDGRIESCMPVYKYAPGGNTLDFNVLSLEKTAPADIEALFTDDIVKKLSIKKVTCGAPTGIKTQIFIDGKFKDCESYPVRIEYKKPDPVMIEADAEIIRNLLSGAGFQMARERPQGKYYIGWIYG